MTSPQAGISPVAPAAARKDGWTGIVLVAASAVAFSTAGYFTRLITLDAWTMLVWRGVFGGLFIAAYVVVTDGRRTLRALRTIWPVGIVVAACSTLGTICFINALRRTTVADVTLIYATAPFLTAALGRIVLHERESRSTLVASAVALLGVLLMVGAAVAGRHVAGDLLALAMTAAMAVMMVVIRRHRDTPMLPAAALSAFASALLALPAAGLHLPNAMQFLDLALFGVTQFGLGLLLLTLGTRLIAPTRAALIGNLESPLAPLLVWLAFGEVPPAMTCIGGALVLLAVLGDLLLGGADSEIAPVRAARVICRPPTTHTNRPMG